VVLQQVFMNLAPQTVVSVVQLSDHTITTFIIEILVMLLVGRLLGEVMHRLGQPAVMGQLLGGILLGPSVLGAIAPGLHHSLFPGTIEQKKMIEAVSQLGVLMLLLLTGMETDLALVNKMRRKAIFSSLGGILIPFACGFILGELLPDSLIPNPQARLLTSLFLATALSISSVKIVAMVLIEVDFMRRNIGQIILASAILDDTIGWIIIALIGGIAESGGIHFSALAMSLTGTIIFLGLSFTIGRRAVSFLIRWTNDNFTIEMPVISAILCLMFGMALLTEWMGVHTVLGAFVAGVLVGQSPILTKHIEEQLKGLIVALFMPVFFAVAGLSIDLSALKNLSLVELGLALIAIASFGKIVGCYFGGRLGSLTHPEATALAIGMNARGSTEVIVATIGLGMGVLSQDLFTLIVVMAITTTVSTPPLLRWALARIPLIGEEKVRLDREVAEEKDFVPKVQRVLIAVEKGRNGSLASLLAGYFSGTRKMLSTVLELEDVAVLTKSESKTAEPSLSEVVKGSAESAANATVSEEATGADSVRSIKLSSAGSEIATTALLTEARKGYDVIFFGVEETLTESVSISRVLEEYPGLSAIVIAKGRLAAEQKVALPLHILVPTTGTEYSRKGAELAIAIAKGCGGTVTALFIASPPSEGIFLRRAEELVNVGRGVVRDIKKLGEREGVVVKTLIRRGRAVEHEIMRQAKRGSFDLLVLGVTMRPGTGLFFGQRTATLKEHATCSLVIVNS